MEISDYLKRRLSAAFIDSVLLGCVCLLLHVPVKMVFWILPIPRFVFSICSILMLVLFGALTLLKDGPIDIGPLAGQSIGKKMFNLKVTRLDGTTLITFKDSIARNIPMATPYFWMAGLWIAQALPFIGPTLTIAMFFLGFFAVSGMFAYEAFLLFKDPEHRRWGDRQAGSRVVDE